MAAISEATRHHAALRGPSRAGAPAVLVDIEAEDFVAALGSALKRTDWPRFGWPARLPLAMLAGSGTPRALFQPIHRRFNLLLLDTHCDLFGSPRLDPKKIESSGFVVRRWLGPTTTQPDAAERANPANWSAWRVRDGEALGWTPFTNQRDFDADPDPARRPSPRTGNATLDARLAAATAAAPGEAVNKLYPLAPEINAHAQRTLLYGLVPAGEAQRKSANAAVDYAPARAPGPVRNDFIDHLSPYLRRTSLRELPSPGAVFDRTWLDAPLQVDAALPDAGGNVALQRAQFVAFIRQLALEFQIDSERAARLRSLLDQIPLQRRRAPPPPAGMDPFEPIDTSDFLVGCARLVADENAPGVRMPERFGPVPEGWVEGFTDAALDVLAARSGELRTLESRFDDADALFALRAFIRVRRDDGCPAELVWSEMTPLYRIAPWFAGTGAPQARIALPPFDKESLRAMKPNVAFELPPSLHNLLANNSPTSLLEGGGSKGSEFGLGWLCSFSIPIITICAFIALNVILSLLNIFLRWMPFVKICLPIPTKK